MLIKGLSKNDFINRLLEISNISDKMKLDMFKDILDLPYLLFLENVSDWLVSYGFKLEKPYINFESDSIQNIIDILDKKFDEWEKLESIYQDFGKIGKVEHALLDYQKIKVKDNRNELMKYDLLKILKELNDLDTNKLFNTIQIILNHPDSANKLNELTKSIFPSSSLNSEQLIDIASKNLSFRHFVNILNQVIYSTELHQNLSDDFFKHRKFIIKNDKPPKKYSSKFIQITRIRPLTVLEVQKHVIFFVKKEDYFAAKRFQNKLSNTFSLNKIKIMREPSTLLRFMFSVIPDKLSHKFKIEKDPIKQSITLVYPDSNGFYDVMEEIFEKYVTFEDFFDPIRVKKLDLSNS